MTDERMITCNMCAGVFRATRDNFYLRKRKGVMVVTEHRCRQCCNKHRQLLRRIQREANPTPPKSRRNKVVGRPPGERPHVKRKCSRCGVAKPETNAHWNFMHSGRNAGQMKRSVCRDCVKVQRRADERRYRIRAKARDLVRRMLDGETIKFKLVEVS